MEEQPGPSRQGYCGYCALIYINLEQHVSSPGHRARVSLLSRTPSLGVMMERFLQDVLLHHPHGYADTWSPPEPRDDHTSCWLPHPDEAGIVKATAASSHSERLSFEESPEDTPLPPSPGGDMPFPPSPSGDTPLPPSPGGDTPIRPSPSGDTPLPPSPGGDTPLPPSPGGDTPLPPSPGGDTPLPPSPGGDTPLPPSPGGDTPLPHLPATASSSIHRKCQSKTNRRRPPSSLWSFGVPLLCSSPLPGPAPAPLAVVSASSSPGRPQGDVESFYSCTSSFQRTCKTEDWDPPVQVAPGRVELHPPIRLGQSEAWRLTRLTESQMQMDDRVYAWRLNSALRAPLARCGRGQHLDTSPGALPAGGGQGRLAVHNRGVLVEDVRPCPAHIPESFRGKTLEEIERDDELKVERLVRQFRHEHFLCYFDSESLARCGRRSPTRGGRGQGQEATELLPLFDHHDDEAPVHREARGTRAFRMASRCQVVKVSHGTQTTPLVVPAVRQPAQSHPLLPPEEQPANRQPAESPKEEEEEDAGRLPPCYSNLLTPLQPSTSLLLLLCSPGPASTHRATPSRPTPKRSRRRSRPSEGTRLKVRYQRPLLRWYDPATQRVLVPGLRRAVARQLFRSLSPNLNAHRRREEQEDGPPTGGVLRTDSRGRWAPRGRGLRKGGQGLTPGRGRGRRPEGGEASSRPQPRWGGGQLTGGPRKAPGTGGPMEASARSLRIVRKTGRPLCNQ